MKQTREETRVILTGDTSESLMNTWNEYSDDAPLPPAGTLIESILDLMEKEGDILIEEKEFFKLPDLARELKVNPKVARDKYRKALAKGSVPESLKATGWVFHVRDRDLIIQTIKLKRS